MAAPDDTSTSPDAAEVDRRLILAARTILVLNRELERVARGADITVPQYRFLLFLKRGPKRAADLASDSAIGRPTASALIADMERNGLIRREADETDGRSVRLMLTDKGVAKHAAFERELARYLATLIPAGGGESILEGISELAYLIDSHRSERTLGAALLAEEPD